MSKVLIFTGAGFSYPLELPLTTGFKNLIDSSISTNLRPDLVAFLDHKFGDIEHILSTLEAFQNVNNFPHFIVTETKRYKETSPHNVIRNEFIALGEYAQDSIAKIKRGIYNLLRDFNDDLAADLYISLLKQVRSVYPNAKLSFFTTNYDLTFEAAIQSPEFDKLNLDVDFGFKPKFSRFVFDSSINYEWDENIIEYKKLHGSLDWVIDNSHNCTRQGANIPVPADPNKMPLLYPGYKDTPTEEPFKTIHDHLLNRLLDADEVIVIGFAFRDSYINGLFDTALRINQGLKIKCFNPADIKSLPTESRIRHFKTVYPNRFEYIQEGIEISENPLPSLNISNKMERTKKMKLTL